MDIPRHSHSHVMDTSISQLKAWLDFIESWDNSQPGILNIMRLSFMSSKNKVEKKQPSAAKKTQSLLHARNRHQGHYDFAALIRAEPSLAALIVHNPEGMASIDFADPLAVRLLNKALLQASYGIKNWGIPPQNLCPPIPGRADYLHYLADLLAGSNQGRIPKGQQLHALDIGTGASCVYPLLGSAEYGWQFTATDINPDSLDNAQGILDANPALASRIHLRLQSDKKAIFNWVVDDDAWFDISMCNPPFHASAEEAQAASLRKWENLNKMGQDSDGKALLNFSGLDAELWCEGGEAAFIQGMIRESAEIPTKILWFSSLVSKSANLPAIQSVLKQVKVCAAKTIIMSQGNKESRFVAWTFMNPVQHAAWAKLRWLNNKK